MRQGNNAEILVRDGKLIGVNLGADHCAEHEWGISGILQKLGIDKDKLGLEGRKTSKFDPEKLVWLENIKFNEKNKKDKSRWSGMYLKCYSDDSIYFDGGAWDPKLYTQWSERAFCVISSEKETIEQLRQIYDAFAKNDVAIWRGGGGVFQNPGLCIAIASSLPKDVTDSWYQHDVEHNQLMADFKATGIEEKLKKAGKGYFALSPRREEDGSLIFWLNPMEQRQNNYGWFKLADLEAWARNEGKIPMTEQQKKERGKW